jgi:putative hydrolase of the HAD superfamily
MPILLFDVDGVLIHGYHADPKYRKCWDEDLEKDFGISRADFTSRFIRGVFEKEVLIGKTDLYAALQTVLPSMGYKGAPQDLIDYWMKKDANLNTGLIPYIEQLSNIPNVSLYIATNQEHVWASYLMEELGLKRYFADIFHSARIGFCKPDRKFFEAVEALLNRQADYPVIFFDDHQEIVDGARDAGWEAHLFNVPEDIFKSDAVASLLII